MPSPFNDLCAQLVARLVKEKATNGTVLSEAYIAWRVAGETHDGAVHYASMIMHIVETELWLINNPEAAKAWYGDEVEA